MIFRASYAEIIIAALLWLQLFEHCRGIGRPWAQFEAPTPQSVAQLANQLHRFSFCFRPRHQIIDVAVFVHCSSHQWVTATEVGCRTSIAVASDAR